MQNKEKIIIFLMAFCVMVSSFFGCKEYSEVEKPREEIVISLAGDVMLSRGVQKYLDENGYAYPYEEVRNLFLEDDFTIANLECPITQYAFHANKAKRFVFQADVENARALKEAGFDCLNLANNHSMDYLSDGLGETIENLQKEEIAVVGAGMDAFSDTSVVFEKNGIKVGVLAFSVFPSEGFFYNEKEPTVSYVSDYNLEEIGEKIKAMEVDFKIVYFHWGVEYQPFNSPMQEEYAHMAVENGADFVVGAHPHVLQNTENYMDVPIYYSLGNFVFDRQIQEGTDKTMILQLQIDKEGLKDIKEIPARIEKCRVVLED